VRLHPACPAAAPSSVLAPIHAEPRRLLWLVSWREIEPKMEDVTLLDVEISLVTMDSRALVARCLAHIHDACAGLELAPNPDRQRLKR